MLDQDNSSEEPTTTPGEAPDTDTGTEAAPPAAKKTAKKAAAKKTAKKAAGATAATKTTAKKSTKKAAAAPEVTDADSAGVPVDAPAPPVDAADGPAADEGVAPAKKTAKKSATKPVAKKAATKKAAAKKTTKKAAGGAPEALPEAEAGTDAAAAETAGASETVGAAVPLFQAPAATPRKRATKKAAAAAASDETATTDAAEPVTADEGTDDAAAKPARASRSRKKAASPEAAGATGSEEKDREDSEADDQDGQDDEGSGNGRRRRRRGGRRRRRSGGGGDSADQNDGSDGTDGEDVSGSSDDETAGDDDGGDSAGGSSTSSRRRRRRRRSGEDGDSSTDDPTNTTTRVRKTRSPEDEITALSGSTRLEAKKQRRREGREAGRRRAPIVSEAEFLARREAVDRVMVIRQRKDLTQIAVMEDKVLVEHYVARESQTSLIGNVYLGRVQNVLPSMEAAFIDIGKGRNAVLYAGEVNWDSLGAGNGPRKIEQVLKSGQPVLVQVTKDPVGHKGARLTSQISLPGRFLVYVPDGTTSGISRKLPDTERNRLKSLLKEIVPDTAGVIVRTAAEGASEEELTRDVERLTARWEDIEKKAEKGNAPQLLYGEPDLTLKVVRDLFTEDFRRLVVSGEDAWDMVENYVAHLAPDLAERLERWDGDADGDNGDDVFAAYRIDEQIAKALDRKVWLPSGGSLIIDRTEAMTVVDVNTGKFTGSGGNLEETVTKNNLEAAEEMVRQLRLRDIGGIIVVDFIDMVLESNRDLVLRRLVECLGRDRTRHQVAEVTSLGLVQMTRKRIGTGLLEAFSESCEHCQGRGLVVHHEPIEPKKAKQDDEPRRGRRSRGGRGKDESSGSSSGAAAAAPASGSSTGGAPSPKELAAMAKAASSKHAGTPDEQESTATADVAGPVETSEKAEPGTAEPEKAEAPATGTEQPGDDTGTPAAGPDGAATGPDEPVVRTSRRARRGSSRRAAGPPSAESDAPAVVVPEASPEPVAAPEAAAPAATEAPQTPQAAADGAEPPAAPRVVTSSRRRVARRPAGPPAGGAAAADGAGTSPTAAPDTNGTGDTSGTDEEDTPQLETAGTAAHVPVKRKGGGRKR